MRQKYIAYNQQIQQMRQCEEMLRRKEEKFLERKNTNSLYEPCDSK